MTNLIETVHYFEDLTRLSKIMGVKNLETAVITKRISDNIQSGKIDNNLLKDLQVYSKSVEEGQDLIICIEDLIYAVGNDDQTRITIKIREGECFKVVGFGHDTILFESFDDRTTIRMKKKTYRYYFGVINSKGKSIKEFFNSKIFREMDDANEN